MGFRGSGLRPLMDMGGSGFQPLDGISFSVQPAATRGARRSSGKELRRSIPGPTSRILTTSMRHVGSRDDWAHPARCGALAANGSSFPRGPAVEASFGSPPSRVLPLAPPHRPGSLNGCRHVGKNTQPETALEIATADGRDLECPFASSVIIRRPAGDRAAQTRYSLREILIDEGSTSPLRTTTGKACLRCPGRSRQGFLRSGKGNGNGNGMGTERERDRARLTASSRARAASRRHAPP